VNIILEGVSMDSFCSPLSTSATLTVAQLHFNSVQHRQSKRVVFTESTVKNHNQEMCLPVTVAMLLHTKARKLLLLYDAFPTAIC
jgi:hypothetical protein